MRWEKAVADGLASGVSHALGIFDKMLCGIHQQAGMSPSDYSWLPEREDACGVCREAASLIDNRWPRSMRGEDARVSVARRRIHYRRRADFHQGLLELACSLICLRRLHFILKDQ
ncbi:hypothetical protein [Streptomyces californicus]|uniref:hypothetical protein n=1 Tax=Streptomyces californicus TaxID=67351 RepID=UPI0037AEE820